MEILRIRLFGRFELELGDHVLPAIPTRTAKSLFCQLVLHRGEMIPRGELAARLWHELDERHARRELSSALARVRRVLDCAGAAASFLRVDHDAVGFLPEAPYWLDVEAFEEACREVDALLSREELPEESELQPVLRLYRADLLDDLGEEWCAETRQRLRGEFVTLLERLAEHHVEQGEWEQALYFARRVLHHDPLREPAHRLVMRCHWAAGNRTAALRHFDACERLLREELGAAPARETVALRDAVRRVHDVVALVPPAPLPSAVRGTPRGADAAADGALPASPVDFARACLSRSLLSRDPD